MEQYFHAVIDLSNSSIENESRILDAFVCTMIKKHWFWFATESISPANHSELKDMTTEMIKKHIIENFQVSKDEVMVFDDMQSTLKLLKDLDYKLCLVVNTDFHILEMLVLKQLEVIDMFDDFIIYQGVPNKHLLEPTIRKYEDMSIKRFEMAIVSRDIQRDLSIANE
eukprot:CAMPEP_0168329672 /NCGR_PEP_ID=MMETSP0213-20121227/7253_1 /TAXON_ID=151035 /ORGANISM="Euplotes harpa, Strain FSP1.4" /LENGTH=167 /DNA_ID=CAMNT_0008333053 /DNA_START=175 /DNA_END=678 /DNA_ORIENTATION=-